MSWKPVAGLTVAKKLGTVEPAINTFASDLDTAVASLDAILKTLTIFQQDYTDPTAALASAVINELENLVKDLAGIGGYMLVNLPKGTYTPNGWSHWVSQVQMSFDDKGDHRRPQFSDSAVCGGLVLVAGAPSLSGFLTAIKPLGLLFDLNGFDEKLEQILASQASYQRPTQPSEYPDWQSFQARDLEPVSQIETELLGLLANLQSQVSKADSVYKLFAEELTDRINTLKAVAERLKKLAKTFGSDLNKTGFYQLEIPESSGGVNYYKKQLMNAEPPGFSDTSYIAGVALCGGAGTLAGLQKVF